MPLLEVANLTVAYQAEDGTSLVAVEDLSFQVEAGQALGVVGESGCGKTTALLALLRLLPPAGRVVRGAVRLDGVDLLSLTSAELRARRWRDLAVVFQGAMNALNPVRTIGSQISETLTLHLQTPKQALPVRVGELLELVGIPAWRAKQYPHQFSGGMRQRAMIAMALACNPRLLIADEPTTALDVLVQAQIMDLLDRLRRELDLALIIVTHDLGVVAQSCQHALVMYGGRTAEQGPVDRVFTLPQHPYTQGLLAAFPELGTPAMPRSIPGTPPRLSDLHSGCRFHPRCPVAVAACHTHTPLLRLVRPAHQAACHLVEG
jgi:peptide/nickel transport system ATP-binding protein